MKTKIVQLFLVSIFFFVASVNMYAEFYPDGGEVLIATKEYVIRWDASFFAKDEVQISLWMYKESKWKVIGTTNGEQGRFMWHIPYLQGDQYRIKVQSVRSPTKLVLSTTFFAIMIENNGGGGHVVEPTVQNEIQCIPTPATTSANCLWNDENAVAISIYSLSGIRMYHQQLLSSVTSHPVHCKSWISGTYIVDVFFSDGKHKIGKFVKID